MESKKTKPIVEESEECMVSVTGGKPTLRTARFLHPIVTSVDEAMEVPHVPPLLSEIISFKSVETWPLKVQFQGWRSPQRKWKQWVDKLVQIHEPIWRKACIYDAIMASTYNVRKVENLVFGLAELWCPETNTFVFPWGEATVTLEDMLILGGFSVLGKPVTSPLHDNLFEINEKVTKVRKGFWSDKTSARKPACSSWINHFINNDIDRDLEHVGFLVLWLARYVFPKHPKDIVGTHVFSIAIHLAQGTRIALAPAVLSRLYRDLSLLNQNVVASNDSCEVWATFHILQMWAWEHFAPFRPDTIHVLLKGEPRVARWHELSTNFKLEFVRSVLKSSENFQCRCYASNVINWRHPSFYNEKEMWVLNDTNVDDELQSFGQCLIASELVGIDCIEQYLPHRVAMQFGLDQDLPGYFTRANLRWADALKTYYKSIKKAAFYVPPRLFESDVTTRYLEWWKQSMRKRSVDTTDLLLHQRRGMGCEGVENEGRGESYGPGPPESPLKNKKYKLQEDGKLETWSNGIDELPISQSLKLSRSRTDVVNLPVSGYEPSSNGTQYRTSPPSTILSDIETKRRSSTAGAEKNASIKGDRIGDSTQSDLGGIGKETLTSRTNQDTELENRVLKLEKGFAGLKARLMAKVEMKRKTQS